MRNVLRTQRADLDCVFERRNLTLSSTIRYVNTKHQIADILTKGSWTRDRWSDPPLLFEIIFDSSMSVNRSNLSAVTCAFFSNFLNCNVEKIVLRFLVILKEVRQEVWNISGRKFAEG